MIIQIKLQLQLSINSSTTILDILSFYVTNIVCSHTIQIKFSRQEYELRPTKSFIGKFYWGKKVSYLQIEIMDTEYSYYLQNINYLGPTGSDTIFVINSNKPAMNKKPIGTKGTFRPRGAEWRGRFDANVREPI